MVKGTMRLKTLVLGAIGAVLLAVATQAQATGPKWKLQWNTNPEVEVISYGVYSANTQNGTYALVATVTEVAGATQSWDVPVGTYDGKWFRVSAINDAGLESDLSNAVKVPVKPTAPSGVNLIRLP